MLRRTPIFTALEPPVLASGLQEDLHLLQKVLWNEAENVSFYQGRIKRRKPDTLVFTAGSAPIRGITQLRDSNGVRWIWTGSGGEVVRWYSGSPETIVTGATWTEDEGVLYNASFWDLIPYGDWCIISNGRGNVQYYDPSGPTLATLGDAPTDVVALGKKLDFLLAIGYGAAKNRVGWSDSGDILTWTAAADNLAGSLTIDEFDTPIRSAARLGESISLYAEDQLALFNYVGSPYYFGYKFKLDGIGACGRAAVASDGKNNLGVGRNGIWWTDGVTHRYLDEGYLRDYLQENVNWDQQSKIVCCRNDITGCFEFCFPLVGSDDPNEAWAVDPRTGAFHQVPVFSSKDERRLFDTPLTGSLDGKIYYDGAATAGNSLTLKTKPLLAILQSESGLTDVHNNVHVDEVDLFLKSASNVQFRVGSCQTHEGTFTYTDWIDLITSDTTYKMPRGLPSGVYHKLEFQSTSTTWDIDLQGIQLFANLEGTKRSG